MLHSYTFKNGYLISIKNILTVTRREVGGDNVGKMGEGLSRNVYKAHMDKAKVG